jgi:hypothetical protein
MVRRADLLEAAFAPNPACRIEQTGHIPVAPFSRRHSPDGNCHSGNPSKRNPDFGYGLEPGFRQFCDALENNCRQGGRCVERIGLLMENVADGRGNGTCRKHRRDRAAFNGRPE